MITGMTGFGAGEITLGKVKGIVEIKTVNHRYLDVAFYLPVGFSSLEDKIQKIIAGQVKRGRVTVSVKITERPHTNIIVNQEAVKRYLDFAKALGGKYHIKNDITVADIMRLPGVVEAKEVFVQAGELWPVLDSHNQSALMYYLERATAREQLRNAHSAIADVGICAVILDHICQELGVKTIEDLYAESEKARTPTTMPFGKHKGMLLADVPSDYKQWLLTQGDIDPYLRKALGA